MSALTLCPSCRRHVFMREDSCPHCAAPRGRSLVALVVSTGLGLTGCASADAPAVREASPGTTATATVEVATPPNGDVDSPPVAVYGPPPSEPDVRRQEAPEASSSPSAAPAPSAASSTSASATPPTASATASPKKPLPPPQNLPSEGASNWRVKKGGIPVPVYGPPPRKPPERLQ